ncbi:MAG: hypothetical protein ACOY5V_18520, partial [Pseudomonadota bacterium]
VETVSRGSTSGSSSPADNRASGKRDRPFGPVDICRMSAERIVDYVGKVWLLRRLLPHRASSYKSPVFRQVVQRCNDDLAQLSVVATKRWSPVTAYNAVLSMRRHDYELRRLENKGTLYCPHAVRKQSSASVAARVERAVLDRPHETVAQVARRAGIVIGDNKRRTIVAGSLDQ